MDFTINKFKKIVKKIVYYIAEKCTFDIFKNAIYHKKKLTEEDIYKAFNLKNVHQNQKETEAVISIILEYLGYDYDKKTSTWVLDDNKKI